MGVDHGSVVESRILFGGTVVNNLKTWVKFDDLNSKEGVFEMKPLNKGMGVTIGNSLRRVLLSSLQGCAVVAVKIEGVTHEFTVLPNVLEDIVEIIANVKGLVFQTDSEEVEELTLSVSKEGVVTGKDIELPGSVKLINSDQHIATLSKGGKLSMTLKLASGVGYNLSDQNRQYMTSDDEIAIDSSFSPIVRVNHTVESTRVGESLNYDLLKLTVVTDGSIAPEVAVKQASEILTGNINYFHSLNEEPVETVEEDESEKISEDALSMSVDDLELSARSSNCLKRAGIKTIRQLLDKNIEELEEIKNFGKKSADEINDKLSQYNLELKCAVEG